MSAQGIHNITARFKERWLSPLQFPGSHRTTEQRLTDLENARHGQQPANPRIKIRAKGQKTQTPSPQTSAPAPQTFPAAHAEIKRVGEDHSSSLGNWHAQHSSAASDLLHTFNSRMDEVQGQSKPSTSGGWAAYNDTFSRPSSTPAPAAPKAQPTAAAPVKSPQQFERKNYAPAATAAPRPQREYSAPTPTPPVVQAAPQHSAGGVGRGVQRGLFSPKDAGPKVKATRQPQQKTVAPGAGPGQMSFDDLKPASSPLPKKSAAPSTPPGPPPTGVKMTASKPPAKKAASKWGGLRQAQPAPAPVQHHTPPKMAANTPVKSPQQFPSDSEWHSMLSETTSKPKSK
jgi:hypothetical protein